MFGVIAHETGHIALGHLFRSQETMENLSMQAMLANILGVAAAITARDGGAGVGISAAGQGMAIRNILPTAERRKPPRTRRA